jgi:hypothetical protein
MAEADEDQPSEIREQLRLEEAIVNNGEVLKIARIINSQVSKYREELSPSKFLDAVEQFRQNLAQQLSVQEFAIASTILDGSIILANQLLRADRPKPLPGEPKVNLAVSEVCITQRLLQFIGSHEQSPLLKSYLEKFWAIWEVVMGEGHLEQSRKGILAMRTAMRLLQMDENGRQVREVRLATPQEDTEEAIDSWIVSGSGSIPVQVEAGQRADVELYPIGEIRGKRLLTPKQLSKVRRMKEAITRRKDKGEKIPGAIFFIVPGIDPLHPEIDPDTGEVDFRYHSAQKWRREVAYELTRRGW